MSAGTATLDHVRALLTALLDDAALFPPGSATLAAALPAHRAYRRSWFSDLVGPFVCAASRVGDLADALGPGSGLDPLPVVLVADTGVVGVERATALLQDDDRLELVGLELALPRDGDPAVFARHVLSALTFAVPTAIEVPLVAGWQGALDVLAEDGAERAKFRTGGPTGEQIPTPAQLAELVVGAVTRRVPFKLTAGLHHAVRGQESTDGVAHHGFLNALAATAVAVAGGTVGEVAAVLADTDAAALQDPLLSSEPGLVRAAMLSFGTCSITGPVADLVALGLLEEETA